MIPSLLPSRSLITCALSLIPTHRQMPQLPDLILSTLIAQTGASADEARAALTAALSLLDVFNGLMWHETADGPTVQTRAQLATYFLHSTRMMLAAGESWHITPELMKRLEQQRLDAAEFAGTLASPSREQTAALVLIVQHAHGETQLLHQFDTAAKQYQLIGGRLEPGESTEAAAWREFQEEIGVSQPRPVNRDEVTLQPLLDVPAELQALSNTYGVLTHYTFFAFHLRLAGATLQLGPLDRWISAREMLAGHTDEGQSLGVADIAHSLDARLVGGLAALPSSFD